MSELEGERIERWNHGKHSGWRRETKTPDICFATSKKGDHTGVAFLEGIRSINNVCVYFQCPMVSFSYSNLYIEEGVVRRHPRRSKLESIK